MLIANLVKNFSIIECSRSHFVLPQMNCSMKVHRLIINLFEKLFSCFESLYVQKNSPMKNLDPNLQAKKKIVIEMRLFLAHVEAVVPDGIILDNFSKLPHREQEAIYSLLWIAHGGGLGLLTTNPLNIDNKFGERFMQSYPSHISVVDCLRLRINALESEIRSANFS